MDKWGCQDQSKSSGPEGAAPVQFDPWDPGLPSPTAASYPLLWVQEDLGVKELVAVTVLALPLSHQFAEVGGITDEAWGLHGDTETDT